MTNTNNFYYKDPKFRKLYSTWLSMRNRCANPNNQSYRYYGGKGIKVCKRWNSFKKFADDVGFPSPEQSIDRINSNSDYKPSNVRWASKTLQNQNRTKGWNKLCHQPKLQFILDCIDNGVTVLLPKNNRNLIVLLRKYPIPGISCLGNMITILNPGRAGSFIKRRM